MQTGMQERAQRQVQWLLWQTGSVTVNGDDHETPPFQPAPGRMPEFREPPMNRGRYESVVRRMQQAGQRTGTYTPWS